MIYLDNVTVHRPGSKGLVAIARDQTIAFRKGERVGILAPAGSGRTTLARVIGGAQLPDRGHVHIEGSVGWPIGFANFMNPMLRLSENIIHVAGLIAATPGEIGAVVAWLLDDEAILERKVMHLAPSERAMVAYAVSLAVPTDHVIADEKIMVNDSRMGPRCDLLLRRRLNDAGLIFLSRSPSLLSRWADEHYVLLNERLAPCGDPETGQAMLDEAEQIKRMERTDG